MGAYIATFVEPKRKSDYNIVVKQGHEIGKYERVIVHISNKEEIRIAISGTAIFVENQIIILE